MKKIILLSTIFFCCLQFCIAQSGRHDSTFGTNGVVTADLGKNYYYPQGDPAFQVLLQPDGSMYVLHYSITKRNANGSIDSSYGVDGSSSDGFPVRKGVLQSDGKMVVIGENSIARYNSNGSRDHTFSVDKKISDDGETFTYFVISSLAVSLAIQNDGKIVVAGTIYHSDEIEFDFAVVRFNIDGSLDGTFDDDGKLYTDFGSTPEAATSIAIQSDGKIVVAGNSNNDFALARYNNNGSLDNTFSDDGKQTTDFNSNQDNVTTVVIQKDGKIILAGTSLIGPYYAWAGHFALARYNSDGTLDKTFSSDGKQTNDFGSENVINSVAIQSDGRIVVAGYYGGGDANFCIARYNSNGSLDKSFSEDGIQTTVFGSVSYNNQAYFVAIQPDGKLIAAGYASPFSAIARYNEDGSLDNTFGEDGKLMPGKPGPYTEFRSCAVQKDGKIIVAGTTWNGNNFDFAVARYNTDGSLDKTFNTGGKQYTDINFNNDRAFSVAVQSDGKIVVVGYSENKDTLYNYNYSFVNYNISIVRYNIDGSLDNSFSNDGKQITDFASRPQQNSVAIQTDGKIVVAGNFITIVKEEYNNSFRVDFVIIRYNSDGSLDHTFSDDGKEITQFGGIDDQVSSSAHSIAIHTDGKIVAGGWSSITEYGSYVIAQYNTDGSLDWTHEVFEFTVDYCSIAIQNDQKIIIAARTNYRGYNLIEIARFNPDGSLDNSFPNPQFGGEDNGDNVTSMSIQNDGKIVLVGSRIFRYNTNGSLDSTFGDNGIQRSVNGSIHNSAIAGNKLYVVGDAYLSGGSVGIVARHLLDDKNQTAPTVNITSPANNATFTARATITLSAKASDEDGTIKTVDFYNGNTLIFSEKQAPFTRKWYGVRIGNYSITAKATDNDGNITTSDVVNMSVVPDVAPLVSITSPIDGASFIAPATIQLSADASDVDGTVKTVDFYNGNTLIFTEQAAPFERKWYNVPEGNYSLTAVATDNNGKETTSAPIAISVTAAGSSIVTAGKVNFSNRQLSLNVNPNPVSKTLSVSVYGLQANNRSTISVLSVSGVLIKTVQSGTLNKNVQLDVSSLSAGVYFIKVINGDKVLYKQFVKL